MSAPTAPRPRRQGVALESSECLERPERRLSTQEVETLTLLAEGHTIDRIARRLEVSERTVRRRLRTAADALGADSTIQAVVSAVRHGLI